MKKNNNSGFGLMQIVLVIAMLAVISLVVFLSTNSQNKIGLANDARRWDDVRALAQAVELYQLDYHQLPVILALDDLAEGEKIVICSSPAVLTCDDQSHDCLVVDDSDFLNYFASLPVDPVKSSAVDTGYYISRQAGANDQLVFGSCQSYQEEIELVAKAVLPAHVAVCGDGKVSGNEVCDPPDNLGFCGDGIVQYGWFCNSTCSGYVFRNEACDYMGSRCGQVLGFPYTFPVGCAIDFLYCKDDCSACVSECDDGGGIIEF